ATPAGQALLEDVRERVHKLDLGSRFPVRLSWLAALLPVGGILLAVLAVWYNPTPAQARNDERGPEQPPANPAEIENKLDKLAVRKPTESQPEEKADLSRDRKEIDADLDKLAQQKPANKEQMQKMAAEMTALENKIKDREKALAEKNQALKDQLKNLSKMT